MNEATRKKILYVVLALAVVWGVTNIDRGTGKTKSKAAQSVATPKPALSAKTGLESINIDEHLARPWGIDPFRIKHQAPAQRQAKQMNWILTGIVYNSSAPLAFINKKTVGIGDTIDGAKVVKIEKKQVSLQHDGRTITLKVVPRG